MRPPARLQATATRKGGEQKGAFGEVAAFDEEGVEPGLEEVVDVYVTKGGGAEGGEDGGGMEGALPGEVGGVGGVGGHLRGGLGGDRGTRDTRWWPR